MPLAEYIGRFWAGAEVMYGVIIAMTFTSVLRGYPEMIGVVVQRVAMTALFCCIAWGIADGLFYLWERNYLVRQENRIIELSSSPGQGTARALIGEQLDDTVLRHLSEHDRYRFYDRLSQMLSGTGSRQAVATREAISIVLGTFLLSAGAGVAVVLPLLVIGDVGLALIVSNLAGILLLFGVGYSRASDRNLLSRVLYGFGSSLVGIIIAVITIALGG